MRMPIPNVSKERKIKDSPLLSHRITAKYKNEAYSCQAVILKVTMRIRIDSEFGFELGRKDEE